MGQLGRSLISAPLRAGSVVFTKFAERERERGGGDKEKEGVSVVVVRNLDETDIADSRRETTRISAN